MSAIPQEKLDQLVNRWETVQSQLASAPEQETYVRLAREFAELDPMVAAIIEMRQAEKERQDLSEMIEDSGADEEMRVLARDVLGQLDPKIA